MSNDLHPVATEDRCIDFAASSRPGSMNTVPVHDDDTATPFPAPSHWAASCTHQECTLLATEAWRDPTAYKFIDDLLYRIPEARSEFASGPPREHAKVEHEAWVKKCCTWADIGRTAHAATRYGHETLDNALLACWEEATPGVEEKKSREHRIQQNWSYWGFPDAF